MKSKTKSELMAEWARFEIIGRIPLRDKATGKEYR